MEEEFFLHSWNPTLSRQLNTSRERAMSAPYQRLKIPRGLQNVKVLVNWGPFYEKNEKKVSQCRKN